MLVKNLLWLTIAFLLASAYGKAQERRLETVWTADAPYCCERVVESKDGQFVYYTQAVMVGKLDAATGQLLDTVRLKIDSVWDIMSQLGAYTLNTRNQLILICNGTMIDEDAG